MPWGKLIFLDAGTGLSTAGGPLDGSRGGVTLLLLSPAVVDEN
jgi:hypothetical protein